MKMIEIINHELKTETIEVTEVKGIIEDDVHILLADMTLDNEFKSTLIKIFVPQKEYLQEINLKEDTLIRLHSLLSKKVEKILLEKPEKVELLNKEIVTLKEKQIELGLKLKTNSANILSKLIQDQNQILIAHKVLLQKMVYEHKTIKLNNNQKINLKPVFKGREINELFFEEGLVKVKYKFENEEFTLDLDSFGQTTTLPWEKLLCAEVFSSVQIEEVKKFNKLTEELQ